MNRYVKAGSPHYGESVYRFCVIALIDGTRTQRGTAFQVDEAMLLNIQFTDIQRVLLDELAARFDFVAHQNSEHVIRLGCVIHFDLD